MLRLVSALSLFSLALTGCELYAGDDQPPQCGYGYADDIAEPAPTRDPYTGQCVSTGGGYYCDEACGPCPAYDSPVYAPGATCYGACAGLDENSCLSTPTCHAAYGVGSFSPTPGAVFESCWDIAPLPATQGQCMGLDAWTCSMHDDCISLMNYEYGPTDQIIGESFGSCAPETAQPQSCDSVACEWGSHCEEQCYTACPGDPGMGDPKGDGTCWSTCAPTCVPDYNNSCAAVDCGPGYMCVDQCDGMYPPPTPTDPTTGGGMDPGVPTTCYATCVQVTNEPGTCDGEVLCDAIPPACPANTTAGILNGCYSGYCIPNAQCGPQDPGSCEAATCAQPAPSCPVGSTAGVKNGCYTGYCIPNGSCPVLACEALTTEGACSARSDCTPVYAGDNCTCFPDGSCTCSSQSFTRCETWWL